MDVLNFLLWPFRQGIWFLKFGLWLMAVLCVIALWSLGWLFNGDQRHKKALADYRHPVTATLDLQQTFGTMPFRFSYPDEQF